MPSQKTKKTNEVDRLVARIERIRKQCKHSFVIIKISPLQKTLFPGVYIGKNVQSHTELFIDVKCTKCSLVQRVEYTIKCAQCLGKMVKGEKHRREDYFGNDYIYYAVRLYKCKSCGFAIAVDEWDQ